jgi:N-acetylated-alpha-linked acidic dipeptidase
MSLGGLSAHSAHYPHAAGIYRCCRVDSCTRHWCQHRAIQGLFAALENPREKTAPPQKETVPPFLDFAPLQNGLAALERTTAEFDRTLARASENGGAGLALSALKDANDRLVAIERVLTASGGLPNRPWFQHMIYAPGF